MCHYATVCVGLSENVGKSLKSLNPLVNHRYPGIQHYCRLYSAILHVVLLFDTFIIIYSNPNLR